MRTTRSWKLRSAVSLFGAAATLALAPLAFAQPAPALPTAPKGVPAPEGPDKTKPKTPAKPTPKPQTPAPANPYDEPAAAGDAPKDGTKPAEGATQGGTAGATDAGTPPAIPPATPPPTPAATPPATPAPLMPPASPVPPQKVVVTPDPDKDAATLLAQGKPEERPVSTKADVGARPSDVYAEDWWSHARPTIELHGYYRVRAELFHQFALDRGDTAGRELWPQPPDRQYVDTAGNLQQIQLCGSDPQHPAACDNNTNAGANMRFRLSPEIHISDNLRILSQIDMLDNVVLGSTPEGYANQPGAGYNVVARGGYSPTGAFASTQWAPSAGYNSTKDSILVKRVWGEYLTPIGLLRFGRMPSHWGLGMLANGGDGFDSDYQSTSDRLMLVTGIKKYDLYFAAAWDFANEGATSASLNEQQGQPYDLGQEDDVDQYVFVAVHRTNPDLQKLKLAKKDWVLNGGGYFVYRSQLLANDSSDPTTAASINQSADNVRSGYVHRGAEAFIPDLWVQFLYEKFRFEAEAAMIWGSLANTSRTGGEGSDYVNPTDANDPGWKIRQFGLATQTEYRALEDKLRVNFGFGYASGDDDVDSLAPQGEGLQPQRTADRTFSTFRFHPDYRVDLIMFRHILQRVQGAYYFKPGVEYDFTRDKSGQKLGGGASVIWSRASEFVQTPGHARDLGIELNFKLYFQAKDGSLNDDLDKMGGFYTQFEYGVMFPLGGLDYLPGEVTELTAAGATTDTATAQTLRWFLGIMF